MITACRFLVASHVCLNASVGNYFQPLQINSKWATKRLNTSSATVQSRVSPYASNPQQYMQNKRAQMVRTTQLLSSNVLFWMYSMQRAL